MELDVAIMSFEEYLESRGINPNDLSAIEIDILYYEYENRNC